MKIALALFVAFVLSSALEFGWGGFMFMALLILIFAYSGKSEAKKNDEASDLDGFAQMPTRLRVQFDYMDAQGNQTKRTVAVKKHDRRGKTGLLQGVCEEKQAMRSFRFDRIQNAVDADTGELLPNLQKHLNSL